MESDADRLFKEWVAMVHRAASPDRDTRLANIPEIEAKFQEWAKAYIEGR